MREILVMAQKALFSHENMLLGLQLAISSPLKALLSEDNTNLLQKYPILYIFQYFNVLKDKQKRESSGLVVQLDVGLGIERSCVQFLQGSPYCALIVLV